MPLADKNTSCLPCTKLLITALLLCGGGLLGLLVLSNSWRMFAASSALCGVGLLLVILSRQHKQVSVEQQFVAQLKQDMADRNDDLPPQELSSASASTPDQQQLIDTCNRMNAELTEDLRSARQFAANVTHELRTPLTILRGETELALRSNTDSEQLHQVLESNLEEISRMSFLIEDLLLLSKSDLGEIPLRMEKLDLTGLLMELHHQSRLLAAPKEISVDFDCPEDQIVVEADSLRLRQVLLNLLTNAVKYTPHGGRINIGLKQEQDKASIEIKDTGIGMEAEHIPHIFDRFYRIGKTSNRNDGGSGLGLAIAKWIVDAHRGTIKVTSIPGQGSCFEVTIPCNTKQQKQS